MRSSNPTLLSALVLGGSEGQRTLTATAAPGQTGDTVVTIRVKDGGNKITESCFTLTVVGNPTLSQIFPQIASSNVAVTVDFNVFDLPGEPYTWAFSGTSSDQNVVADDDITFSGYDTEQTVTVTPQPDVLGNAIITITVASGGAQASTNFLVRFAPDFVVEWDLSEIGGITETLAATGWRTTSRSPNSPAVRASRRAVWGPGLPPTDGTTPTQPTILRPPIAPMQSSAAIISSLR